MSLPVAPVPRIVLDTNVCLDLFLFRDAQSAALLESLQRGLVQAVTREDCRAEWLRVLHYPQLPVDDGNRAEVRAAFDALVHCLPPDRATIPPAVRLPRCGDDDDQKFLELASAAGARWLLSKDRELLKLDRRTRMLAQFSILTPQAWTLASP